MVMLSRMLSVLIPVRVSVGYASALVAVATTLVILGPHAHDKVVSHLSTNLHNLTRGHVGTLLGSAFVTAGGPMYVWLPGLFCLLAVAELLWRSRWLVLTFAVGHIGATLIVAAGLASAVSFGWLPVSVGRATDVGISYGAAAVLGALTAAIPARWRPAWIGWWLAAGVVVVSVGLGLVPPARGGDFTDVGHIVALVLGMLVSTRFRASVRWTPLRFAFLVVGVLFGFLILVNTMPSLVIAPLAGLLGAFAAHWVATRWRGRRLRRSLAVAAVVAQQPVLQG